MESLNYLKSNVAEIEIIYKNKVKQSEMYQITSSSDVVKLLRTLYNDGTIEHHEQMVLIMMNNANKVLGYLMLSSGGISGTVCDPKLIFQAALKCNASHIIISHNHPSGNAKPSLADQAITQKIKNAGEMLEIKLLDHIIITSESFFSFTEDGIL